MRREIEKRHKKEDTRSIRAKKISIPLMEAELPEERINQALTFFNVLGNVAKIGFKAALSSCGCHVCREILGRIELDELR